MSRRDANTRDDLSSFRPAHSTFVGVDSDGCVFDTMGIKQIQCFHPLIIAHWRLEPISKQVRETAEFVNLYSRWRGQNRFLSLLRTFDFLRTRPEVVASGVRLPSFGGLRAWTQSGVPLGNPELERATRQTGSAELADVLEWSLEVNRAVQETVGAVPPFRWARESLERIREHSDAICVSQTPAEALVREWEENRLAHTVAIIAGQELGTKAEHIRLATQGRYAPGRILMIGDAPGDRQAATANGASFYPINPGHESRSWDRFCHEAYDRFLAAQYAGAYQDRLVAEFEALLPETPPWETT